MIRSRPGLSAAVTRMAFIGGLLTGGGAASGRVVGGGYVDAAKGIRVDLPRSGWQVTQSPGADLVLQHTGADTSMAGSARGPEQERASLPALARHVFFGLRPVEWLGQDPIVPG